MLAERPVDVGIDVDVVKVINHPLTRMGGGAGLTSLREGRRHSAACVRCPSPLAIVKNHPTCQGEVVGLAARRPFDECWRVPRKVALVEHLIYYKTHYLQFKGFLGPGPTQ